MRLVELAIRNFRGFGPAVDTIDLSGDLNLLYGPNGHGKTSMAEAIEWLFYGTTKRRQRGEEFSRTEFAGSFANAHGNWPTEVSLKAEFSGRITTFSRRLEAKDKSTTLVDGSVASFESLGIIALEAHYPVVAQHGLQTFVHSKPKDRRDAICAALGLDELTSLKSALDSARASFQRTPPATILNARKHLNNCSSGLAHLPELRRIAQRWAKSPPVVEPGCDEQALILAVATLTGEEATGSEEAITALRTLRERASKSVFDLGRVQPLADRKVLKEAASQRLIELIDASQLVDDALSALAGATAASFSAALLSFWREGLQLATSGSDCPMCEAETLILSKREALLRRIEDADSTLRADAALRSALEHWRQAVAPAGHAISALGLNGLGVTSRAELESLLSGHPDLPTFFEAHDALISTRTTLGQALRESRQLGFETQERSGKAEQLQALIHERQASRHLMFQLGELFFTALEYYDEAWQGIEEALYLRIAASDLIVQIDGLSKALDCMNDIDLLARYAEVLAESQGLIRLVEEEAQTKQEILLASRGQEVKDLYRLLNPGASVGFDTMEPANDAIKLHATSFGVRMSAAANLSECQLNCLGLAVCLMRANTPTSPFNFIFLDDPVQAMDDDHAEAFISQVVPHLLDEKNKQVIVLSHLSSVIDKLRHLNLHRNIRHYHIESFEASGPVIVRQLRLQQMLADIKGAAAGNENNRKYSVDRLRVLTEEFVRELYLRKTGTPPPASYDTANSGQLADLFRIIPDTDPGEHNRIKDTIRFCDPAHHTQVGYAVPLKSNIQPHVDRVSDLLKKYRLI